MKKRFLSKVLLLLLSIVMMFTLLVACNPEDEKVPDPTPTPPTMQDYLGEVGAAMDKALSINAGKPFNLDLMVNPKFEFADKSKEQYNWDYSVILKGNINFAETVAEGQKRSNELDFAVVNNTTETTLFALDLDGEYAYVTVGEEKFKFSSFDFYSAIRALTGKIYDVDSSLASVDIVLAEMLPLLGGQMFTTFTKTAVVGGFDYKFNFDLKTAWDNIIGAVIGMLPADININALLAQLLNCEEEKVKDNLPNFNADIIFNVENGEMVGIDLIPAKIDIGTFNLDTKLKCNPGINASFNLDKVRADFASIEAVKLLNINMSGTINLVNEANPDNAFFTMDWKLVANMDPMLLVQEKFNLDSPLLKDKDNFFHFQLNHICNDICKNTYCKDKLRVNDTVPLPAGDKGPGALLDIAYAPADIANGGFGHSNLAVAFNLNALISKTFVKDLLKDLIEDEMLLGLVLGIIPQVFPADSYLTLDLNALINGKDDLSATGGDVDGGATAPGLGSIDINGIKDIIEKISSLISTDEQGLAIDLDAIGSIVGDDPIISGKSIGDLINLFLDGPTTETKTDKIVIAGEEGLGSEVYVDLFNPMVKYYNVHDEVLVYANRENNILRNFIVGESGIGAALKVTGVETNANGIVNLYSMLPELVDGVFAYELLDTKLSAMSAKDITNYYVKYNYIDVYGSEATDYVKVEGTKGLDLTKKGVQEFKLLTNFAGGLGVLTGANALLNLAGMFVPSLGGMTIENVLSIVAENFDVKYELASDYKYVPGTVKATLDTKIDTIDFGKLVYTYADGTTTETVVDHTMVTFAKGKVIDGKLSKLGKTSYTVNCNGFVINNHFDVEPSNSNYTVSYNVSKELLSINTSYIGTLGQTIRFISASAKFDGTAIDSTKVDSIFKINSGAANLLTIDLPRALVAPIEAKVTFDLSDKLFHGYTTDKTLEVTLTYTIGDGTEQTIIVTKNVAGSKFVMTGGIYYLDVPKLVFKYNAGTLSDQVTNTFTWKFEDLSNKGLNLFLVTKTTVDEAVVTTETPIVGSSDVTATIDSNVAKTVSFEFVVRGIIAGTADYQYKISCIENGTEIYSYTPAKFLGQADKYNGSLSAYYPEKPSFNISYLVGNDGVKVSYQQAYLRVTMYVDNVEATKYNGKDVYFKYGTKSTECITALTEPLEVKASKTLYFVPYYMDGTTEKTFANGELLKVTYKVEVYSITDNVETIIAFASNKPADPVV